MQAMTNMLYCSRVFSTPSGFVAKIWRLRFQEVWPWTSRDLTRSVMEWKIPF